MWRQLCCCKAAANFVCYGGDAFCAAACFLTLSCLQPLRHSNCVCCVLLKKIESSPSSLSSLVLFCSTSGSLCTRKLPVKQLCIAVLAFGRVFYFVSVVLLGCHLQLCLTICVPSVQSKPWMVTVVRLQHELHLRPRAALNTCFQCLVGWQTIVDDWP